MPSLLEALEKKYCADCQFEGGSDDADEEKSTISIFIPRLPPLLSVPELLVLNDCDIDCAGDFEAIKDKCRRVRELDLAQNKLQDWKEVFHILEHMPRIEFLNLSKNRLVGPIANRYTPPINSLKSMVLNGTYLDWLCIEVLLENLPLLEELHLSLNDYREVLIDSEDDDNNSGSESSVCKTGANDGSCESESESHDAPHRNCGEFKCKRVRPHKTLKTLHFTGNPVESWREICRLGRVFPSLENLVLADCPIKSIKTEDKVQSPADVDMADKSEYSHKHFLNLLFLNLSYSNISTWDDIDQIAKFPKLRNLRVKNWPLWDRLECTEHERRQILIARLPNVSLLNGGGVISADEREDAERAFIRYYMDKPEWDRPKRYDELVAKHGKLDPLVNVNLKPDKRLKVLITYKEKSETRLVDIYCTVSDLKAKLEKIIGLATNKMRLYYLDQDYKEFGPEEMKYPNKLLYSYNIHTGDEIIIDEKK